MTDDDLQSTFKGIAINRDPRETEQILRDELRKVRILDPQSGKRVTRLRRLDPLEVLFRRHRREFPEDIQATARRLQELFEVAASAGPRSLDLARVRVDGGKPEAQAAKRVAALDEIRRIEAELGKSRTKLLREFLHEGKSFKELARARRRGRDERYERFIGMTFRETLWELADSWRETI